VQGQHWGEVARFSVSKESFLTFKADIPRTEIIELSFQGFPGNREA